MARPRTKESDTAKTSDFAQYLKKSRKATRLSQKQVAEALGYQSAQFVSNWERGISQPPMSTLARLAKLYAISADALFDSLVADTLARTRARLQQEFFGAQARPHKRRKAATKPSLV